MQRTLRNKMALFVALIAVVSACLLAFAPRALAATGESASENLDPSATGSITATLESTDGKPLGGELVLYKVADVTADDTGWHFQWLPAYANVDSGLYDATGTLSQAYSSQLAASLDALVGSQEPVGRATVDASGTAVFSNVGVGLYLVKQTKVSDGYDAVDSFVVSVPVVDESTGELVYNVNASPKAGQAEKKAEPENPGRKTTPAGKVSGNLPQTGQLWWPVAVMGLSGAALLCVGIARSRRS